MPPRSRITSVTTNPVTVAAIKYTVIAAVPPVASRRAAAMVGANAPPRIAPSAYEMEAPDAVSYTHLTLPTIYSV